jgi:Anti-sigma-28 factor, FlgM
MANRVPEPPLSPPDDPEIPEWILTRAENQLLVKKIDELISKKIDELKSQIADGEFEDEINEIAEQIMRDIRDEAGEDRAEARQQSLRNLDGTGGP